MEQENKEIKIKLKRDTLKRIIVGLAVFVIVVLIFGAGMFIGGMKARFSYRWAENYHRNFGGPEGGFMDELKMMPPNSEFIEGHGTFGQIIKIDGLTLVIKGRNDVEKIILIKDDTVIKRLRDTVKPAELKVDEFIVVIGEPNDTGQVEAKLIRVLSPMESSFNPPPFRIPLN